MTPGMKFHLGGYQFVFDGIRRIEGPNYFADQGSVRVLRDGQDVAVLHPEKRVYRAQQAPTTEAGIQGGFTRDLFVALGEPLENGAWAVRVQIKRSEEHTSELQSLMRISYAVFCLKKKKTQTDKIIAYNT